MKLDVSISQRKGSSGSATSAHELRFGLVRKAPRASRREEVCLVSSRARADFYLLNYRPVLVVQLGAD